MKRFYAVLALALTLAVGFASAALAAEAAEPEHVHTWDYLLRECADLECAEVAPCWDAEALTYAHDFTDSEFCLVCGAALYCSNPEHLAEEDYGREEHELAACGVPGHFECDELDHDKYDFDPDGHTQCLEEQTHHCDECDSDYACQYSNSHVPCIKCGKPWCDKSEGDHTVTGCGHRECIVHPNKAAHKKLPCGHYACKKGNHTVAACEVENHYNCDGKQHGMCENCGDPLCNGADHHTRLACGHYACDEDFNPEIHATFNAVYAGEYGDSLCTAHLVCQNPMDEPEAHAIHEACGELFCDGEDHASFFDCEEHFACSGDDPAGHVQCPGCGAYICAAGYNPQDHLACAHCVGGYICDGNSHDEADCGTAGHFACDGGSHNEADCGTAGHFACDGGSHRLAACNAHYMCADGYVASEHAAPCGAHFACADGYDPAEHKAAECNAHFVCADGYDSAEHEEATCMKHYKCDPRDHYPAICFISDHFNCDGREHSIEGCTGMNVCSNCYGDMELGDHSLAPCNEHYACDDGYVESKHVQAPCRASGHYVCDKKNHGVCTRCGNRLCDGGSHGEADCGTAGHFACDGGSHRLEACNAHYMCADGFDPTEHMQCNFCPYSLCDDRGGGHFGCMLLEF